MTATDRLIKRALAALGVRNNFKMMLISRAALSLGRSSTTKAIFISVTDLKNFQYGVQSWTK